jgi:hypothetical protein
MKQTIAFGLLLAVGRIWIGMNHAPESFQWLQVYKDAAHLFMGGLAVAWWFNRHPWQWWLFWSLNVVEVAVAILSRI